LCWQERRRRPQYGDLNLFMAVPTVYSRLIAEYEQASPILRTFSSNDVLVVRLGLRLIDLAWLRGQSTPEQQRRYREACARFRLMVSGSAALPGSHKFSGSSFPSFPWFYVVG
jgi:hypothetical protein